MGGRGGICRIRAALCLAMRRTLHGLKAKDALAKRWVRARQQTRLAGEGEDADMTRLWRPDQRTVKGAGHRNVHHGKVGHKGRSGNGGRTHIDGTPVADSHEAAGPRIDSKKAGDRRFLVATDHKMSVVAIVKGAADVARCRCVPSKKGCHERIVPRICCCAGESIAATTSDVHLHETHACRVEPCEDETREDIVGAHKGKACLACRLCLGIAQPVWCHLGHEHVSRAPPDEVAQNAIDETKRETRVRKAEEVLLSLANGAFLRLGEACDTLGTQLAYRVVVAKHGAQGVHGRAIRQNVIHGEYHRETVFSRQVANKRHSEGREHCASDVEHVLAQEAGESSIEIHVGVRAELSRALAKVPVHKMC
mmetsp:Transcript_4928/g.14526  ORF Transcript_4928/g.14526 Transcript_4928/m.14526 type:complete len:366 (+) Transcript_4928:190-1287(+)